MKKHINKIYNQRLFSLFILGVINVLFNFLLFFSSTNTLEKNAYSVMDSLFFSLGDVQLHAYFITVQLLIHIFLIYYFTSSFVSSFHHNFFKNAPYIFTRTQKRGVFFIKHHLSIFLYLFYFYAISYSLYFAGIFFFKKIITLQADLFLFCFTTFILHLFYMFSLIIIVNVLSLFIKEIIAVLFIVFSETIILLFCGTIIHKYNDLQWIIKYFYCSHNIYIFHKPPNYLPTSLTSLMYPQGFEIKHSLVYIFIVIVISLTIGIQKIKHMDFK